MRDRIDGLEENWVSVCLYWRVVKKGRRTAVGGC